MEVDVVDDPALAGQPHMEGQLNVDEGLTRSFMPTSMFTAAEGSIAKLTLVLLLRYSGRFSTGRRGGSGWS